MKRAPKGLAMRAAAGALVACLVAAAGCRKEAPPPDENAPSTGERALVVSAGQFQAGMPREDISAQNPLHADATARASGRQLFLWFNCAGCHGVEGGGAIGPPLRDADWIYGSEPANIFQSIAQGRPNGMPAYGGKIPDTEIWRLELYVRSLAEAGAKSGSAPKDRQQRRPGT